MVHVADPSHHLEVGDELDKFAMNIGTSIYLPDNYFGMFPKRFSQDLCSLKGGEENLAITIAMKIDDFHQVRKVKVMPSILKNICKLNYEQVDSYFEKDSNLLPLSQHVDYNDLFLMESLSYRLREQRTKSKIKEIQLSDFSRTNAQDTLIHVKKNSSGIPFIDLEKKKRSSTFIKELMLTSGIELIFYFSNL